MVADPAHDDFRGCAYGLFNIVRGLAMLLASVLAGLLCETFGSAANLFMRGHTLHRGDFAAGRAPLPGTDFWRRTSVRLKTGAWLEAESTLATLPRQCAALPQHRQNRQSTLRLPI